MKVICTLKYFTLKCISNEIDLPQILMSMHQRSCPKYEYHISSYKNWSSMKIRPKFRWAYKIITLFLSIVIFYRSFEPLRRMASRSPLSHWFPWFLSASTICQNMLHHFSPINKSCLFAYWIEAVSIQLASKQWTWTVVEQAEALAK